MIFASVGTTAFPFERFEILVQSIARAYPKRKVIFQTQRTVRNSYPKNVYLKRKVSPDKYSEYVKSANLLVLHGGYASILKAVCDAKVVPYVMPRYIKYHEHVNDHQALFCDYMRGLGLIKVIENAKSVKLNEKKDLAAVKKYLERVSDNRDKLTSFLEESTLY